MKLEILHEDNHCLVVNKPAGLLSQGDVTGDLCLVDLVKRDLKVRFQKPGNVYLGLIHRLDRPVSGLVLLARTSKAAERLSAQFRLGAVEKTYWAWVEGGEIADTGELVDFLLKDSFKNFVETVEPDKGGKEARLSYRVMTRERQKTLLELKPRTGRSHQIRVQLASRGWPIQGDIRYGAGRTLRALDGGHRIALHARSLRFQHPTSREWIEVQSQVPDDWPGRRSDASSGNL